MTALRDQIVATLCRVHRTAPVVDADAEADALMPVIAAELARVQAAAEQRAAEAVATVDRLRRLCGAWDITGVPDRAVVVDHLRAALARPAPPETTT